MMCVLIGMLMSYVMVDGQPTPVGVCGYKCYNKEVVFRYVPYGYGCPTRLKLTLANVRPMDDPLYGGSPLSNNVFFASLADEGRTLIPNQCKLKQEPE